MNVKINLEFTVNNAQWDFKIVWVFESSQTQEKKFGVLSIFLTSSKCTDKISSFSPREKVTVEGEYWKY